MTSSNIKSSKGIKAGGRTIGTESVNSKGAEGTTTEGKILTMAADIKGHIRLFFTLFLTLL